MDGTQHQHPDGCIAGVDVAYPQGAATDRAPGRGLQLCSFAQGLFDVGQAGDKLVAGLGGLRGIGHAAQRKDGKQSVSRPGAPEGHEEH